MQESAPTDPEATTRAGRRFPALALTAVAVLALAVRLWGLGWQLPWQFHPDEGHYTWKAIDLMSQETLNPKYFRNPSLFTYVLLAEYRLLGFQPPKADEQAATADGLFRPPSGVAYVGRLTSALMGGLNVLAIGWIGWRALGPWTGVLGALFLALAFIHVRDSHYATNDVPSVLLLTLSVGASLSLLRRPTMAAYLLAGLFGGLATSTKYNAGLFVVPLLVAHGIVVWREWKAPVPHPSPHHAYQGAPCPHAPRGSGGMTGPRRANRADRSGGRPRVPGGHAVHDPGLPEMARRLPHPGELRRRGLGGAGEARAGHAVRAGARGRPGLGHARSGGGWSGAACPATAGRFPPCCWRFPSPTCCSCSARSCSSCGSRCPWCRSSACWRPWPWSTWRRPPRVSGGRSAPCVAAVLTVAALAHPTLDTVRHNVLIGREDTRVQAARVGARERAAGRQDGRRGVHDPRPSPARVRRRGLAA